MPPAEAPWLAAALGRLDARLAEAVAAAHQAFGPFEPFRGLHVDRVEASRLLDRERGMPLLARRMPDAPVAALETHFGLDAFESDVVLLALAPEVDLAYERVYAFLHDDVTRRRPSIGLALDLLCAGPEERIAARRRFAADAPLVAERVIALGERGGPLLRTPFELDPQVIALLLGTRGLDLRLGATCTLTRPRRLWDDVPLGELDLRGVAALAAEGGLRLYLRGRTGLGQRELAEAVATACGAPLLEAGPDADPHLAGREALVHGAVLFAPAHPDAAALVAWPGAAVIATGTAPAPPSYLTVVLATPPVAVRRGCWRRELAAEGFEAPDVLVDVLAKRYRLSPAQIASAAAATRTEVPWGEAGVGGVFAAARAQTGEELGAHGRRIVPVHGWEDLVLPPGAIVALRELCDRIVHREHVLGDWGFGDRLAHGKGVAALFTGASGTGKTMAAGVLAATLELDAYRIDLAGIVSPYIGETEKNLDRVFAAAESTDAILFFDEADALFGKRSEVRDARDRYANLEVSYLLQRMEEFDGISILATNFQRNIDEAFLRRLDFTIPFPFPGADERRRIWAGIWPAALPLGDDVDLAELAEHFPLSGGSIRSAALAASYLAAADGGVVREDQILRAVRRELQKIGRSVTDGELATGVPS